MTNSYLTATGLQPEGGYTMVGLTPSLGYSINPTRVFFHNVTFEDIQNYAFPLAYVVAFNSDLVVIDSITVRRCQSTLDVIDSIGSNIVLTNNYIEDSDMLDGAPLSAQYAVTITAKNNTFKDIRGGLVAGRQVLKLGFFGPGTVIEDTQFID